MNGFKHVDIPDKFRNARLTASMPTLLELNRVAHQATTDRALEAFFQGFNGHDFQINRRRPGIQRGQR